MHSFLSLSSGTHLIQWTVVSPQSRITLRGFYVCSNSRNKSLRIADVPRAAALENCRDFTIHGGTFNVSTTVEQSPGDFRVVKLGDLNLLDEIDKQNVVEWHPVHRKKTGVIVRYVKVIVGTRRIYRARIFGSQDPMTVVVYNDAQFEQRMTEMQKGPQLRHPHLAQFFGLVCPASLCALIYHDVFLKPGLILSHVQSRHFDAAYSYWQETTGDPFYDLPGTAWIRLSTGKLCMDVGNGYEPIGASVPYLLGAYSGLPEVKLTEYDLGDRLLSTLELDEFYSLLVRVRISFPKFSSSTPGTIILPSIYNPHRDRAHFKPNDCHAIPTEMHLTLDDLYIHPWYTGGLPQEVLPTGWTRVDYPERHSGVLSISVGLKGTTAPMKWWLSQNHYVRNHLQGAFNATELVTGISFNCTLRTDLDFTLQGTFMADAPTDKVYLFLFPPQVEVVDNLFTVTNPPDTEKYYWAFDPAGLNRLTHKRAEDIGLPTVEFLTELWGGRWEERDYDMVHDFHIAEGFNPYTRDAAIAVGYPLIDIEEMKKFIPRFADKSPLDGSDVEVDNGIYYSLGLC
ncbi:hypothetical protein B0H13DRAFT_1858567 [Mycena leptocephala]|nr:hypothetical protein B0H13DRAFT_1858567 [Mycena leptocephala]